MSMDRESQAVQPLRMVTAAALFDGHDATINIIRRMLQSAGMEVIHLGHNRSVKEIVDAAIQEDAHGIAVSSYQGGHMEFFRYLRQELDAAGGAQIRIFGGGGGTILPAEKCELEAAGVTRIYHPEDGRRLGLAGMIAEIVELCAHPLKVPDSLFEHAPTTFHQVARMITAAENAQRTQRQAWSAMFATFRKSFRQTVPCVGVTGPGGAGKSSLVDELLHRYTEDFKDARVAVLAVDPSKRRGGGALLGDRIRMNCIDGRRVYMRSLATRGSGNEISSALHDAIEICRCSGFDLIIAETSGIGQGDAAVAELTDLTLYVMTPEFGASSQLEKIEMIDVASMIVINKFERAGGEDALRDVRKAYQRSHGLFAQPPENMPVYPAVASHFNDPGMNEVYRVLLEQLRERGLTTLTEVHSRPSGLPNRHGQIPAERSRYLAEVAHAVRGYKTWSATQSGEARDAWALQRTAQLLSADAAANSAVQRAYQDSWNKLDPRSQALLAQWDELGERYRAERNVYSVRGQKIEVENFVRTLSGQSIAKVALPKFTDWGERLHFMTLEHLPGYFPFTAGVFPFKRQGEDPTRMFAGEGGPQRTNTRFHYLSRHATAKRLSTAFDSVTLYGEEPDRRPDIWGKVGNSGVSIAHVEDMEALYAGFDLSDSRTSVSMTINGPAPTILAFFFNAATRQALRRYLKETGRVTLDDAECLQPLGGGYTYEALRKQVSDEEYERLRNETVARLRGTVQADILKEDQAQNTCIFSVEFALRMQGDVQQWFEQHGVKNFYSISVSGYHIAEAGANPITQLAFTLANGFTFVEYFRARGLAVDAFAPNLSFFFSNGMDAEYSVIGRVARRIWAIAMRDVYHANERSQKLKYHIQTSGRSLHAQEVSFNDIRTTLQALLALYDNCNSLHTNAYDEAVTTPTEASVRRALAIQLILQQEFGLLKNENGLQGSFVIEELTELVEEAVLQEFERLNERGGVLGAMERMYQRNKIQEESLLYEHLKDQGSLPIVGVNTFTEGESDSSIQLPLSRSSSEEKEQQLMRLHDFQQRHAERAVGEIAALKAAAIQRGNLFEALLRASDVLSLGQITHALYEVGGQYRRAM